MIQYKHISVNQVHVLNDATITFIIQLTWLFVILPPDSKRWITPYKYFQKTCLQPL